MFQNYIDVDNLEYLPDGEIEVAVKEIILDADANINNMKKTLIAGNTGLNNNKVMALKSNICKEGMRLYYVCSTLKIYSMLNTTTHHTLKQEKNYYPMLNFH